MIFENYPSQPEAVASAAGQEWDACPGCQPDSTHYALALTVIPGERLRVRWGYRPDVFDRESVEALAGRFVRVLEAIAGDPECRVGQIDVLAGRSGSG